MDGCDNLWVIRRHGRWEQPLDLTVAANQHFVEVPDGQCVFTERIRDELVQRMAIGLDAHFAGDWEGDTVLLETKQTRPHRNSRKHVNAKGGSRWKQLLRTDGGGSWDEGSTHLFVERLDTAFFPRLLLPEIIAGQRNHCQTNVTVLLVQALHAGMKVRSVRDGTNWSGIANTAPSTWTNKWWSKTTGYKRITNL